MVLNVIGLGKNKYINVPVDIGRQTQCILDLEVLSFGHFNEWNYRKNNNNQL